MRMNLFGNTTRRQATIQSQRPDMAPQGDENAWAQPSLTSRPVLVAVRALAPGIANQLTPERDGERGKERNIARATLDGHKSRRQIDKHPEECILRESILSISLTFGVAGVMRIDMATPSVHKQPAVTRRDDSHSSSLRSSIGPKTQEASI